MPTLTLTPVEPSRNAVACSEELECSESLACGEIGLTLSEITPVTTLTLTPVAA